MDLVSVLLDRIERNISKIEYMHGIKSYNHRGRTTISRLGRLISETLFAIRYRKLLPDYKSSDIQAINQYGLCLASYVLQNTNIIKLRRLKYPLDWSLAKQDIYDKLSEDIIIVWETLKCFFPWEKYEPICDANAWMPIFRCMIPHEFSSQT